MHLLLNESLESGRLPEELCVKLCAILLSALNCFM